MSSEQDRQQILQQIASFLSEMHPKHHVSLADKIDYACRFIFPSTYFVFIISYWAYYRDSDLSNDLGNT